MMISPREKYRPFPPVNLADRLRHEVRLGQEPSPPARMPTVLVVIDQRTAALPFWRGLGPAILARAGLYSLWRLARQRLEQRAAARASKDWPAADRIRDRLTELNVVVMDGPQGATWRLKG